MRPVKGRLEMGEGNVERGGKGGCEGRLRRGEGKVKGGER